MVVGMERYPLDTTSSMPVQMRGAWLAKTLLENEGEIDPADYIRQFKPDLEYQLRRQPNSVLVSPVSPGGNMDAPMRVVLHHSVRNDEWVTHAQNMQDKGMNWGHYTFNWEEALQDFKARCERYNVDWRQSTITTEEELR